MHTERALHFVVATSQITLHGALHTDHLGYISCCHCSSFVVIFSPLQSLVPETELAPRQPRTLPSGWLKTLIGVGMIPARDMCLCLQTLPARASTARRPRMFSSFVPLAPRAGDQQPATAMGAYRNWRRGFLRVCQGLWVNSLLHHPQNGFPKPDTMLRICCHWHFSRFEVVFVLLMGPFHSHLFKCFIHHLCSVDVICFCYLFCWVLRAANHTCH